MNTPAAASGSQPCSTPRLKHHLSRVYSGGTPETGDDAYWSNDDIGVAWVAIGDMSGREYVESTAKKITEEGRQSKGLALLPKGTLIYSMYATLGHVAELAIPATINQALLGFEFKTGVNPRYVKWQLRYLQPRVVEEASSSTQDNLNAEKVRNLPVPLPPLEQQRAIADYLDRETARLDALVAAKERLLGLLAEKRRALITRAVTRGLDPRAPLRDSGIPWLGEIPEHWRIAGFTKYLRSLVDYRGRTPEKTRSGTFLLTARNVRNGYIDYECSEEFVDSTDINEIMRRGAPALGDILFTTEAPLGQAALVNRIDVALAQRLIKLDYRPSVLLNAYALLWILSSPFQYQLATLATGSTALGIKGERLHLLRNLIPPTQEQLAIVEYVAAETAQLDKLRAATERTIVLLEERRASLIAAAVAGQLKVA